MRHTVLIDRLGWTLYEFERVVTDAQVIMYLKSRDADDLFDFEVDLDPPDANPRMKFVRSIYKPTGCKTFHVFIKERD